MTSDIGRSTLAALANCEPLTPEQEAWLDADLAALAREGKRFRCVVCGGLFGDLSVVHGEFECYGAVNKEATNLIPLTLPTPVNGASTCQRRERIEADDK